MPQKPGKRGRKIGKGIRKAAHSRFGNYAGIMAHVISKRLARAVTRQKRLERLRAKRGGFRTKRAMKRARRFAPKV